MAIPSRQIGWGTEENLLWQISKQLEYLSGITYNSGGGGSPTVSAPTLTYSNVGTLDSMDVEFFSYTPSSSTYNPTGTKTLQSYWIPSIFVDNGTYGTTNQSLVSIIFPDVQFSKNLDFISLASLTSLEFPLLNEIRGHLQVNNLYQVSTPNINMPLLNKVNDYLYISNSTFNLPSLTYVNGNFEIVGCPATSMSFPLLTNVENEIRIYNNFSLTSLTIGTIGVLKEIYNDINLQGNSLDEVSVNGVLALLVSLDGTNGTQYYSNHAISLSGGANAAPTGQGILDVQTLTDRGCTVTTN